MAKVAMDKASSLETKLDTANNTNLKLLGRLEELDAGMVALTKLSNVDPEELSKLMLSELNEIRGVKAASQQMAATQAATHSPAEPAPLSVEVTGSPETQAGNPPSTSVAVKGPEPTPTQSGKQDFESIVKNLQTATSPPAPAATSPAEKAKPLTIAEVDGVLARLISDQWHKPPGASDGMKAEIHIKMSREGKIEKADVTRGSGLDAFDLSAVTALRSIGIVKEVAQLDDATYERAYRSRTILLK